MPWQSILQISASPPACTIRSQFIFSQHIRISGTQEEISRSLNNMPSTLCHYQCTLSSIHAQLNMWRKLSKTLSRIPLVITSESRTCLTSWTGQEAYNVGKNSILAPG